MQRAPAVGLEVKGPPANAGDMGDSGSIPGLGRKIPWRRAQQPTSVFLPGEFHKQGSLVGCNPQSHKELDTSKLLSMRAGPKQERSLISFAKELVPGRGKIWRQSITSLKN